MTVSKYGKPQREDRMKDTKPMGIKTLTPQMAMFLNPVRHISDVIGRDMACDLMRLVHNTRLGQSAQGGNVRLLRLHNLHRPVVVAVVAVGMVKVAVDEVIDVVAVGHGFVTATRSVDMRGIVAFAGVSFCTGVRICLRHR
ncbi:MAG: hypothetical protein AMXMBFR82_15090 [Candidatus Hydrogenedentota bacterium]